MSDAELADLERLCAADEIEADGTSHADSVFEQAARTALPKLLAEVRRLKTDLNAAMALMERDRQLLARLSQMIDAPRT